jgi:hypothetical protein
LNEVLRAEVADSIRRAFYRDLQRLAVRLDLASWVFSVIWDQMPDTTLARVIVRPDYQTAIIQLNGPELARHAPTGRCRVALHELLHVRLFPLGSAVRHLAASGGEALVQQAVQADESTVTGLERALARGWCP